MTKLAVLFLMSLTIIGFHATAEGDGEIMAAPNQTEAPSQPAARSSADWNEPQEAFWQKSNCRMKSAILPNGHNWLAAAYEQDNEESCSRQQLTNVLELNSSAIGVSRAFAQGHYQDHILRDDQGFVDYVDRAAKTTKRCYYHVEQGTKFSKALTDGLNGKGTSGEVESEMQKITNIHCETLTS
jgi:hypothetical protein